MPAPEAQPAAHPRGHMQEEKGGKGYDRNRVTGQPVQGCLESVGAVNKIVSEQSQHADRSARRMAAPRKTSTNLPTSRRVPSLGSMRHGPRRIAAPADIGEVNRCRTRDPGPGKKRPVIVHHCRDQAGDEYQGHSSAIRHIATRPGSVPRAGSKPALLPRLAMLTRHRPGAGRPPGRRRREGVVCTVEHGSSSALHRWRLAVAELGP